MKNKNLKVEIGSSFITVYSPENEILLKEPSVVLVDKGTKKVLAVGKEADNKLGNLSGNIDVIMPMQHGFFIDKNIAYEIFSYIIKKTNTNHILKPSILVSIPNNTNDYYNLIFYNICEQAGIRKVNFINNMLFTALKLNLDIKSDHVLMLVDVGYDITKIAVIYKGELTKYSYVKIASSQYDKAIIEYIKQKHNLIVSKKMAEKIKINIGTVINEKKELKYDVRARNQENGIPITITITSTEISEILKEISMKIIESIKKVVISLPLESIEDLIEDGIYITGGGSKIRGFDEILSKNINLKVAKK